jgi:hypothetical protein
MRWFRLKIWRSSLFVWVRPPPRPPIKSRVRSEKPASGDHCNTTVSGGVNWPATLAVATGFAPETVFIDRGSQQEMVPFMICREEPLLARSAWLRDQIRRLKHRGGCFAPAVQVVKGLRVVWDNPICTHSQGDNRTIWDLVKSHREWITRRYIIAYL